jgi:hypothetical protein
MDSALDRITGQIVEAALLHLSTTVDSSRYLCPGCEVPVIPASYLPENKVRAHFKTKKEQPHVLDCDVFGEAKLVSRAKKERVTSPTNGFPGSYPNRLHLEDEREVVAEGALPQARTGGRDRGMAEGGVESLHRQRRWPAKTIRPLASTFMNYPFDRDLPLTVPGVEGARFQDVFEHIKNNQIIVYEKTRIFYAPIQWSKPVENLDVFEVKLGRGEWEDKRLVRSYRVRVIWADWSESRKRHIRNEIEVARNEAMDAVKKGSKAKGWLFFLGHQAADDSSLFLVKDHRLICCIVDELI